MPRNARIPPAKPTVLDVAAAAAVSVGTVSRVLNTPDAVGEEIRRRVVDAVARIGYKPLRKRRKPVPGTDGTGANRHRGNFGLILFGMDDSLTHLPAISEAIHGVETTMAAEGVNLMLSNIPQADRVPVFLAKNQVDGVILKCPFFGDLRMCASSALVSAIHRVPHVWLLGRPESGEGDMCGTDFDVGARIGLEYLHTRGHRRIGYLHPRSGQTQSESLKRALFAHSQRLQLGLQFFERAHSEPIRWPLPAVTHPGEVMPLVEKWKALPARTRPTAFIVSADSIAVQLFAALRQVGVQVGAADGVSVLSFNHEKPLVIGLNPPLTTIDIRASEIGRHAVQLLFSRIRNREDRRRIPTKILVEPTLIEGGSVAVIDASD